MGADDSIVNGDGATEYNTPADANNRTFLILASLLTGTLLLLSLFTVGYLLLNPAGGQSQQIAAIETQNAVILATNEMVTVTVAARTCAESTGVPWCAVTV